MLDVIKGRRFFIWSSFLMVLFFLTMMIFGKKNLGIDMTGGTQSEFSYSGSVKLKELNENLLKLKEEYNKNNSNIINAINAYGVSGEQKIVVEVGFLNSSDEKVLEARKTEFNNLLYKTLKRSNDTFVQNKYINIGRSFGDYIKKTAWLTLFLALVSVAVYIAFAFYGIAIGISASSFALISLITLFHDVIVTSGFYILTGFFLPEFKIDTFFVTALLTILGYSINDTIVIFDRIRDNIKRYVQSKKLDEIINISINQTLTRSLFTSLTLMFVLISMFFFGPETLRGFVLTLIYGVVFGTYSSIFLASPLLYEINKNKELKVYEKKVVSDDDKIVV